MGMFCLDTNIVIHAINRRRPDFAARIARELGVGRRLMLPAVARFELEYGFANSDRREANRAILETLLASGFDEFPFETADAIEAGDIRATLEARGTPIGPYDLMIAAQARRHDAALVTLDRREFERVPGLIVTDWAS